ncbi:MAG: hypothetical protein K1060chlam5_00168 [Candidatus Anoxychlamydiales bacterium]|nr:hypothetical protein [Candidatus Anoxychlamydiales bacterium]
MPKPDKTFSIYSDDIFHSRTSDFTQILQYYTLETNFLKILSNVQENISFFGSRYITIPVSIGSFLRHKSAHIDMLSARIIELAQRNNFKYTQEERKIGSLIAKKIDQIYADNDSRLKKCNILTRLFCFLRSFYFYDGLFIFRRYSLTRWNWNEDIRLNWFPSGNDFRNIFNYYTKKEYIKKINKPPITFSSCLFYRSGFKGLKVPLWLLPDE